MLMKGLPLVSDLWWLRICLPDQRGPGFKIAGANNLVTPLYFRHPIEKKLITNSWSCKSRSIEIQFKWFQPLIRSFFGDEVLMRNSDFVPEIVNYFTSDTGGTWTTILTGIGHFWQRIKCFGRTNQNKQQSGFVKVTYLNVFISCHQIGKNGGQLRKPVLNRLAFHPRSACKRQRTISIWLNK